MKIWRKVLSIALCAVMIVGLVPAGIFTVFAESVEDLYVTPEATVIAQGTWGGIDWVLTDDGTFTVSPAETPVADPNCGKVYKSGDWRENVIYNTNGSVKDVGTVPYNAYKSQIKKLVIEEGVTSIGAWCANGLTNLTGEVIIPSTVKHIGQEALQKSTFTKLTFAKGGTEELCIGQGALKNLIVEEIVFPDDRPVHLHAWMFLNSEKIKSIVFPKNLTGVTGTNHHAFWEPNDCNTGSLSESKILNANNKDLEAMTFSSEESYNMVCSKDNSFVGTFGAAAVKTADGSFISCKTLAVAAKYAKAGDTVTLLKDTDEVAQLPAGVVLDKNGKTAPNVTETYVAKVGETKYKTIDEAIANWANGTTLTLLADVTLTDVIKLSSKEYHVLDLGSYTMTAASGKDAIQYVIHGRTSASAALDIKADATNPGGITATGKTIVSHTKPLSGAPSKDRPITSFYGGVFNASYVVKQSGYNNTNAPYFYFYGGEFNGIISTNRSKMQFHGGTFNGNISMSLDSNSDALVLGGKFKNLSNSWGSTLSTDKFTIGSAFGVYDREVYVDDDGYYVIAVSDPSEDFEAAVTMAPNSNNFFYYSKVATEGGINYTDARVALQNNNTSSAKVTVYTDEIDLTGIDYKGTIVVPEGKTLKVTNAPEGLKTEGNAIVEPAAKIGETKFASLAEAFAAAEDGDTITLLQYIKLTEAITVNKDITLDLNGKTLTLPVLPNYAVVIKDTLTIIDTSAEKNGKVINGDLGFGLSTSCTGGLYIKGGNFESKGEYSYLIGAFAGEVVITGGNFDVAYSAVNSFAGYSATVSITGGNFVNSSEWASYFTAMGDNVAISGGTYNVEIVEDYIAEGYMMQKNEDGSYGAVVDEFYGSRPIIPGAQYRLPNEEKGISAGLRFLTEIALNNVNTEDSIKKMGTIIMPADKLGDADLVLTENGKVNGISYVDIVAKKFYEKTDEKISFTAVLIGIPETQLDRDFVAVSYIEYTDGTVIYGKACVRSINGVLEARVD